MKVVNVTVESYWPSLFAKLFKKRNLENLVTNVVSSSGATIAVIGPLVEPV